jgi:hypothetical protein
LPHTQVIRCTNCGDNSAYSPQAQGGINDLAATALTAMDGQDIFSLAQGRRLAQVLPVIVRGVAAALPLQYPINVNFYVFIVVDFQQRLLRPLA